jgi:LuxR family transcriptional regulator, maltose regulon positive regulatory protein
MATAELAFDLIEAKLAPPALRAETVAKTELIDRLCASELRVVSMVAPAGFGKTTLLAQWAERDPRRFATVSLDERDKDAVVLLRYVVAALDRVAHVSPLVFEALWGPGRSLWSTCIPRVGAALSAVASPIVLVLDDLHAVSDPACLDAIAALLEHVPEGSQIVVATREDPELPLARLRAQDRVLEIGLDDLRLTKEEAAQLLRNAGVNLDLPEISDLTRRTEGWPAGLYLAALSLRAGASDPEGARAFSGDDRFVADYLRLELLSRMTAEEVRFLTHTSVLDRICGGLCNALLQRSDSAGVLESLERSNRFLVPLDRRRHWYRYHHLFRDLLRSELERREPGLALELNRRAMEWCVANEMPEAAIHYGHEAGEIDAVARLVEVLTPPTYYAGGIATVETWLDWYDEPELLKRYPPIAVLGAWMAFLTGRPVEAERRALAAEEATSTTDLPDDSGSLESSIATLRAYTCADGIERMLADSELALRYVGEAWWRPGAHLALGVAHALLGDTKRAAAALSVASEVAASAGAIDEEFGVFAHLALLAMADGAWEEAESRAARAVALVNKARLDDYLPSGLAYAAQARVALHQGDVPQAREYVAKIHRVRPQLNYAFPWYSVQVGLELARVHLALGEAGVAGTVLSEAEAILRVRPRLGTLVADARELREHVTATSTPSGKWALSVTAAELRLLPLLTTHLSYPQIGERLFVSNATVKTHALSIYRKFGVSSRTEAIERAVELGLLEDWVYPARRG